MKRAPGYTPEHLAAFRQFLSDGKWHLSTRIHEATGVDPVRQRVICGHTHEFIGSQEGYKLASLATPSEREHARRSLLSRATKIIERAMALA